MRRSWQSWKMRFKKCRIRSARSKRWLKPKTQTQRTTKSRSPIWTSNNMRQQSSWDWSNKRGNRRNKILCVCSRNTRSVKESMRTWVRPIRKTWLKLKQMPPTPAKNSRSAGTLKSNAWASRNKKGRMLSDNWKNRWRKSRRNCGERKKDKLRRNKRLQRNQSRLFNIRSTKSCKMTRPLKDLPIQLSNNRGRREWSLRSTSRRKKRKRLKRAWKITRSMKTHRRNLCKNRTQLSNQASKKWCWLRRWRGHPSRLPPLNN